MAHHPNPKRRKRTMDTLTIPRRPRQDKPFELLARIHALKISQNAIARAIRSDSGTVSRVLRGITTAAPLRRRMEAFLTRAERRA
jgi:hypothetical protein